MEVRFHRDPQRFWSLAGPFFASDPAWHTMALTVARQLIAAPDAGRTDLVLLTVHTSAAGGRPVAAALRTPPWPLLTSGIPARLASVVAAELAQVDPALPGAGGPRDTAEPFAAAWARHTGRTVREDMAERLYRLEELVWPTTPGRARPATQDDLPLLVRWLRDFELDVWGAEREPGQRAEDLVRRSMAMGNAQLLWEADGQPVALAGSRKPINGMSRVGPVYTPPEHRCHGYGSAVTAAASQWALDAGAGQVVLFTDLANPVSNSIYQRIGYRPRYDAVELIFESALPAAGLPRPARRDSAEQD